MQMLLAAPLIDAPHPAFEDREIALDGVGVDFTTAIFANAVLDPLVIGEDQRERANELVQFSRTGVCQPFVSALRQLYDASGARLALPASA
jgi:hypothetical protein